MKSAFLLLALLITSPLYAKNGNNSYNVSSNNSSCTTDKVIENLLSSSATKQIEIVKNTEAAIKRVKKIIASIKNKDSKKPIGELLSAAQANEFSEYSNRIGLLNMTRLIEGNYERDLTTISHLNKVVDDYYYNDKVPESKSQDALYFSVILAWRKAMPQSTRIEAFNSKKCSLDYALYNKEIIPLIEISKSQEALKFSLIKHKKIIQKYNMKNLDYEKLSDEDKHEILMLRDKVFLPIEKENLYIQDLENIRRFAKIVDIEYISSRKDLLDSGGNADFVGSAINNLIKTHQLNEADKKMVQSWNILNEEIPSEVLKSFKPK